MENDTEDRRVGSNFERHLQTILASVAILLMAWVGLTTYNTSVGMATFAERMSWMGDSILKLEKRLQQASKDRYSRQDAQRDYTQNMRRFETIEARVTKLETKP